MKSVDTVLKDQIRQSHSLNALPRLTADWNMNRFKNPVAYNVVSEELEGYDVEMFPIESIVEPFRPTKGILKARVGESAISSGYNTIRGAQYYLGNIEDQYKYWTSPQESDAYGNLDDTAPYIVYDEDVDVNKIVIKVENTWASPAGCNVYVQYTDGGAWSRVSIMPEIHNDGSIVLYWNGFSWSVTRPADMTATRSIRGIKFEVMSLEGGRGKDGSQTFYYTHQSGQPYRKHLTTGSNSFFNLIEIAAHLEVDLSDRVISTSDSFDLSDTSFIYPLGTLTSNTGEVELYNGDGYFDTDNESSPLHDLLEPNVEFNLEYIYNIEGQEFSVQQFRLFSEGFSGQKDASVHVSMTDHSKYLKEVTPTRTMYQNISAQEIVWRLCDSVGFNNYSIDIDDEASHFNIPVFWTDGEQTLWEIFDELSRATQTAIYFDCWGVLQIKTRQTAFDQTKTPVWTLRSENNGNELADIVELSQNEELGSNHVSVSYKTTKWDREERGIPVTQKVWEPEGDVVLRAAPLRKTLDEGQYIFYIPSDQVEVWQYSGLVQIQGEIIRYDGKYYTYYTGDNGENAYTRVVYSAADKEKYDNMTLDTQRHKNHFTGAFLVKERGVWNSEDKRHSVDADWYDIRSVVNDNRDTDASGFKHLRDESKILMQTGGRFKDANDFLFATRGRAVDSGFYYYGTKLEFVKEAGRHNQQAGIAIHLEGGSEDGYFIEIQATDALDNGHKARPHNEVRLYSRINGKRDGIGPTLGRKHFIAENVEYEIDVSWDSNNYIGVWINGKNIITERVPSAQRLDWNGRFGMFVRGQTAAKFEYLYAVAREEDPLPEDFSFLDKAYSGYTGNQWDREWVYRWRTNSRRKRKRSGRERSRWNQMFMDEFGPIVHEVREFDVDFDPAPVWGSYLYSTNDWQAIATEYRASPFGAHFVMANTSRKNAVLNGEDTITLEGGDESINQIITAMGRVLVVSDAQTVVAKDEEAILRRGKIESSVDSDWIQSKEAAEEIAEWIRSHWSTGVDVQEVRVFGNPLIEIGDVVSIEYPLKHMSADSHKYFVTAVSNSFNQGIETSLSLRRVV